MSTLIEQDWTYAWINPTGEIVGALKAHWDAPTFRDFGSYLVPGSFYE